VSNTSAEHEGSEHLPQFLHNAELQRRTSTPTFNTDIQHRHSTPTFNADFNADFKADFNADFNAAYFQSFSSA
jgi:hypothetical protein